MTIESRGERPIDTASAPEAKLAVKVVPRAARNEIAGRHGDRLRVRVVAAPERGRANRELESFLAQALDLPRRHVRVVSGHASPQKTVAIRGITQEALERLLAARLGGDEAPASRSTGRKRRHPGRT